jgi:hypothetical protein
MFEDLIREVSRLEQSQTISVPLPEDKEGYIDRQCPSAKCRVEFKVFGKDWDSKVAKKLAYCPVCRNEAPSVEWATAAQVKYAKAVALEHLKRQLHDALEVGARQFNQHQHQTGFITLSLSVTPDTKFVSLDMESLCQCWQPPPLVSSVSEDCSHWSINWRIEARLNKRTPLTCPGSRIETERIFRSAVSS